MVKGKRCMSARSFRVFVFPWGGGGFTQLVGVCRMSLHVRTSQFGPFEAGGTPGGSAPLGPVSLCFNVSKKITRPAKSRRNEKQNTKKTTNKNTKTHGKTRTDHENEKHPNTYALQNVHLAFAGPLARQATIHIPPVSQYSWKLRHSMEAPSSSDSSTSDLCPESVSSSSFSCSSSHRRSLHNRHLLADPPLRA